MCFPLWLSGLGRLPDMQAVRVQSSTVQHFFVFFIVVVCLFVLFAFLSLDMFSFYSTVGPLFELHEVL